MLYKNSEAEFGEFERYWMSASDMQEGEAWVWLWGIMCD